jgi:hypothetical protein
MALTRITTGTISANAISAEKMQNAAIQARHFQTGTITLDLMDANANVAAAEIRLNANIDIVQNNVASNRDSINIVQSNLVLAEANVELVSANHIAFATYANTNLDTKANVSATFIQLDANLDATSTNVGAVIANATAFGTYANTNLDTKANVSATYFLALANDYASYTRLNSNLNVLQDNISSIIDGTTQFTGPVTMQDSLTVQGNVIIVGAQVDLGIGSARIDDATILLAANTPADEGLATDAGILINRGANDNVFFGFATYGDHIDFIFTEAPASNAQHYATAYIDVHANSFGTEGVHDATFTALHHADHPTTGIYFPAGEGSIEFSSGGSVVANVVSTGIIADSITSGTVELRANDYATYTILNANINVVQDNVATNATDITNLETRRNDNTVQILANVDLTNDNAAAILANLDAYASYGNTNFDTKANVSATYIQLNANVNSVQGNLSTAHTSLSANINTVQTNVDAITGGGTFLAPFMNVNTASGTSNVFFVGRNIAAEANVNMVFLDGVSQPNTEFVVNAANDTVQFTDATIPSGSIVQIYSMS